MSRDLSHLDEQGRARMVDVTDKAVTQRVCVARGEVRATHRTRAVNGDHAVTWQHLDPQRLDRGAALGRDGGAYVCDGAHLDAASGGLGMLGRDLARRKLTQLCTAAHRVHA